MKIGLILPSILAKEKYNNRIFAPKDLFILLVNKLVAKGHEVFVYSSPNIKTSGKLVSFDNKLESEDLYSIKDINRINKDLETFSEIRMSYEYGLNIVSQAFSHAQKNNLDLIHIYLSETAFYFLPFINIPHLITIHDPVFPEKSIENWKMKRFSKYNFISISEYQKKQFEKNIGTKFIGNVYHGLPVAEFESSLTSDNYMSMIGRFLPQKGFEVGIKLAQQTKKPLHIASSSNYEDTDYFVKKIKPFLNSSYIFKTEFLQNHQKNLFLKLSKLFLFPILWEEPFGMVMVEAMACGTPIVAFARGSVPEIIKDGETGFIVNPSNDDIRGNFIIKKTGFEGLKQAVEKIYDMPEKQYEQMRKNCRIHVENKFSSEKMVEEYEKTYQEIIDNKTV